MSDQGTHFDCQEVRDACEKWEGKTHTVAAYSPWINGLVEGTNKLLIHILKRLCTPGLGEDDYDKMDLPKNWPDHFDEAIHSLNHRILPSLRFSLKELLLGMAINTSPTPITTSTQEPSASDTSIHMPYAAQQQLDGYVTAVKHSAKQKAAFDKKKSPISGKETESSKVQKRSPGTNLPKRHGLYVQSGT